MDGLNQHHVGEVIVVPKRRGRKYWQVPALRRHYES